jgi:signal transduction histidine kinase/DNA-binding response OmpR family regulator
MLSNWARLAGGVCFLWGAAGLFSALNLPGPRPDGAAGVPAALGGLSLWLRQSEESRVRRWLAFAASLAVAWCGVQSLAFLLGGVALPGPLNWAGVESTGGVGLSGGLAVTLFGLSLLLLPFPAGNQAAQFLTLTGVIVAGLAGLRGIPWFAAMGELGSMTTMPPASSLPLLILGAGLFGEHQRRVLDWLEGDRARLRLEVEKAAADDMVRLSSQFKSEFLVNMSHEFRTPMNGVLGMTEALLDTDLDDHQKEFVQTARQSASLLAATLQSIMSFWEGQSGSMTYEPGELDIREAVAAAVRATAPSAQKKGLELAYLIGEDCPPMVRGDRQLVVGALLHLLSNAVKFSDAGEITVHASKASEAGEETQVVFSVSDSGPGVAPEAEGRLYQPFAHGAGVTTRKHGGVGLGLALAKRMVETMGGTIGYRSTPGQGATFWFSAAFTRLPGAKRAATGLENRRALVVGEKAAMQSLLHLQLVSFGMSSDTAAGPAQALVSLSDAANRGRPFAILFLNDDSPAPERIEFTRKVRAYPFLARTKIVLLRCSREAARDEELSGVDAVVAKPVAPDELESKLRALLAPAAKPTALPADVRARARILIAEDDKVNQKVALLMLKKLGLRADVAPDGVEAVRRYKDGRYDLILMDCNMPEMDGYQATGEIRRMEGAGPRVPIIALTANALKSDRKRCLDAGMDAYLTKPVNPDELLSVLSRWLKSDAIKGAAVAGAELGAAPSAPEPPRAAKAPQAEGAQDGELDEKAFADLKEMGGGDDLIKEVVNSYLNEEAPVCMRQIQAAVLGGLCEDLRKAAHKLKGSSRAVGARNVSDACHRLEEMGREGKAGEAPEVLGELVSRYDMAHEALVRRIS